MPVQTDGHEDYKGKYKILKRKLKILIYVSIHLPSQVFISSSHMQLSQL